MSNIHEVIWKKFGIKLRDNLPHRAWEGHRQHLAQVFNEVGFKSGAEVGVRKGEFSLVLCQSIPGLKLLSIDPWTPYVKANEQKQKEYYEITVKTLAPYNAEIIKKTSMEAVKDVPDGSLDFVYIDGLHDFDSVIMDILEWNKKVKRGGIISGDDFIHGYQIGVMFAVEAYTRAHNINPWYLTNDREPTWFWVKP